MKPVIREKLEPNAIEKINLYLAAIYLYSIGKSHPHVVKILREYCSDIELIVKIADKAMKDEWDKLYDTARKLFALGKTHEEVITEIRIQEEDMDVADFIVNKWCEFKTIQINSLIESRTNIAEGSKVVVISALVLIVIFIVDLNIVSKILWSIVFVASLIQWGYGIEQRKLANQLKKIFESDEQD